MSNEKQQYRIGDRVEVIDRTEGHKFNIGDFLKIIDIIPGKTNHYHCEDDKQISWYLKETEFRHAPKEAFTESVAPAMTGREQEMPKPDISFGQLLKMAIDNSGVSVDHLAKQCELDSHLQLLIDDKVFLNNVPVVLVSQLIRLTNIPFSVIKDAATISYNRIKEYKRVNNIKQGPWAGLWENEEALGKYLNHLEQILQEHSTPVAACAVPREGMRDRVAEVLAEDDGYWKTCSGCHESEDGHDVGEYPHSETFKCKLGGGCRECGGIGVIWEYGISESSTPVEPGASEVDGKFAEWAVENKYHWFQGSKVWGKTSFNAPSESLTTAELIALYKKEQFNNQ